MARESINLQEAKTTMLVYEENKPTKVFSYDQQAAKI